MSDQFVVEYPETLPDALHVTPEQFEKEARLAMAVKLFELHRISSGAAAELAGLDRVSFLMKLHEFGTAAISHNPSDFASDVANA